MKNLTVFLEQNNFNNKTVIEKKQKLRKLLIAERKLKFKLLGHSKWGKTQFLDTLNKLNLTSLEMLQSRFQVACFFPIHNELNLLDCVQPNWLMPKICKNELHWFEYGDGKTDYICNKWGIPEKKEKFCFEYQPSQKPLLCFVPGLAGDKNNNRLGYGKGFYDKFLSKYKEVFSVLCLPSKDFMFDELPTQTHDVKMKLIVY